MGRHAAAPFDRGRNVSVQLPPSLLLNRRHCRDRGHPTEANATELCEAAFANGVVPEERHLEPQAIYTNASYIIYYLIIVTLFRHLVWIMAYSCGFEMNPFIIREPNITSMILVIMYPMNQ